MECCEVVGCDKQGLIMHEINWNNCYEFHQICEYHDKEAKEGIELNFRNSYCKPNQTQGKK